MVLTAEHAQALAVVLAGLLGGAVGWWLLAPWAQRALIADEPRSTLARAGPAAVSNVRTEEPAERPRAPASWRRWSAAAITGVSWALVWWRVGDAPVLPAVLVFASAGAVLSIVDLVERRLPNRVVGPAAVVVGLLLVVAAAGAGDWAALGRAVLGGAAMFAAYLVVALISPAAMGMGDVKLAGLIGLLLGWFGLDAWLLGLLAAFVLGGLCAVVALALRRVTLRGSIPFGPSMLAGAMVAVLAVG